MRPRIRCFNITLPWALDSFPVRFAGVIVSHEHRFIFLKTRKTASTSIEVALSRLCGDHDIITPISPPDEEERRRLGLAGPQNFALPLWRTPVYSLGRALTGRSPGFEFVNHTPAAVARRFLDRDTWNSYFKFSFERNPFDRVISQYYFETRSQAAPLSLSEWISRQRTLSNWDIYAIGSAVAVDFLGRYETLEQDLRLIGDRIGVEVELPRTRLKGGFRKDRRPPGDVLDATAIRHIEARCGREIELMGYSLAL